MLILLPPSEGKREANKEKSLEFSTLSFAQELTTARQRVLSMHPEISTTHTEKAIDIYTGVLYQALGYNSLSTIARKKADKSILIFSAVYGVIRPNDEISTYKAKVLTSMWKEALASALAGVDQSLVVDMRSSTYSAMWNPEPKSSVGVRIFTLLNGEKKVITHMSKKYRGEIARLLLLNKIDPTSPEELESLISSHYPCSLEKPEDRKSWMLDVIISS